MDKDDLDLPANAFLPRGPRAVSRRSFLAGSLAAAAGLAVSGDLRAVRPGLAAEAGAPAGLSDASRAFIDLFCETFIPDTGTCGAKGAGVPQFVELLVASTPRPSAIAEFEANIALICRDLDERGGASFAGLAPQQREAVLAPFDHAAVTATADRPYYRTYMSLRVLALLGYYTTREGASEELRYELAPGRYDADIPIAPADRAFSNGNV